MNELALTMRHVAELEPEENTFDKAENQERQSYEINQSRPATRLKAVHEWRLALWHGLILHLPYIILGEILRTFSA